MLTGIETKAFYLFFILLDFVKCIEIELYIEHCNLISIFTDHKNKKCIITLYHKKRA